MFSVKNYKLRRVLFYFLINISAAGCAARELTSQKQPALAISVRRERERAAAQLIPETRDRHPEVLKKTLSISWIGSPQFFCL